MTPAEREALALLRQGRHDEFDDQVRFRTRTSLQRAGLASRDSDTGRFEITKAGRATKKGGS